MTDTVSIKSVFNHHLEQLNGSAAALSEIKKAALESFVEMKFPTSKNEEWKYTPTLLFAKSELDYSTTYKITGDETLLPSAFEAKVKIVFINGVYSKAHSTTSDLIEVMSITEASSHPRFLNYFNTLANNSTEPYTAFNTCFFKEGVFITVKKNAQIEGAIVIEYHETEAAQHYVQQIRNLLVIETGAIASFIVKHAINHTQSSLSNTFNELIVEENAQATIYLVQNELHHIHHINTWEVEQKRDARCNFFTYSDSASLLRNNLHILMNAAGLTCDTKGIYLASKKNIIDNHLKIEHKHPHCSSFQLYRGIMQDEGTGVFNGKIHVHKYAQKTDAYQSNKNLLLSSNAYIYTKPQLEIFADDVKCSHGATIGNLDEAALFYCTARGIRKETAKMMLTVAFANEVLNQLENEAVQQYVEQAIERALITQ